MLSIVIPVFNEKDALQPLYQRLKSVLTTVAKTHEIIFIDDGSTDNSLDVLKQFAKNDKAIKIFSFRKNQGKAEGLTLGFQIAEGEKIITLDADLQDRPEEIPALLKKMDEGYDVVSGWRKNRKDKSKMVIASKLFNTIARSWWGINLHDYNCGLKAYSKDAAKSLRLYGGMHRFIPLLIHEKGFRVTEIVVEHDKRKFGKSKYGFSKTWKDLPDMFTILFLQKYAKRPLHFFGSIGSILMLSGLIFISYLSYLHYFKNETVGTRPLWSIGVLFILAGMQIFFTGFLADLIINISQNRTSLDNRKSELKYSTV